MLSFEEKIDLQEVLALNDYRTTITLSSYEVCANLALHDERRTNEERQAMTEILDKFIELINVAAEFAATLDKTDQVISLYKANLLDIDSPND